MKRVKTSTCSVLCMAALLAVSCGKKEGALNHGMKIDYIMSEETITEDDRPYYRQESHISEEWCWDGKEVYRIDHFDSPQYSENFFYDGRHRIVRTTVPAYRVRNEFSYDSRKLKRIECYHDDELVYTIKFRHDGKELVGMDWHYVATASSAGKQPLPDEVAVEVVAALTGKEMAGQMLANNGKARSRKENAGAEEVVKYDLTWNDGNISEISCTETGWSAKMAYDSKTNPFHQLYGHYETNSSEEYRFEMLSKNNMVKFNTPSVEYTFKYKYDGDYPRQRVASYAVRSVNQQTWDSVTYLHIREENIFYK